MKNRWTPQEDKLLKETILENLKLGNTQLHGLEEAMKRLPKRTFAACGFRWNAVVRHKNESELEEAIGESRKARGYRRGPKILVHVGQEVDIRQILREELQKLFQLS